MRGGREKVGRRRGRRGRRRKKLGEGRIEEGEFVRAGGRRKRKDRVGL